MKRKKKAETGSDNGIVLNGLNNSTGKRKGYSLVLELVGRGCLLFSIIMGTIGCFTSSFGISYHVWLVFPVMLVIDMLLGLIFYKNWIKNLGYILLFIAFLLGILRYAKYVVSGFYGIVNICFAKTGAVMNLSNVMSYNEIMPDRVTAITCFLIFYGIGLSTMLNSLISNYMSVGSVMLVTLPICLTGLYVGLVPGFFYSLLLIGGFVTMYAMKKNIRIINGKSMLQFMGLIFAFAACFLLFVNFLFPGQRIGKPEALHSVRAVTDEYVARFVSGGLLGMFNRYSGAGGMSGGELGGMAIVNPDYETDLRVRMVPYTMQTMYLKGFVGIAYNRTRWITGNELSFDDSEQKKKERDREINRESNSLAERAKKDTSVYTAKMEITNLDADTAYRYFPYYSMIKEGKNCQINDFEMTVGKTPVDTTYPVTFYPAGEKVSVKDMHSSAFGYDVVPEENYETLARFCQASGVRTSGDWETIVERLRYYFQKNYPYSKRPGILPRGKDFVNYFLDENKTGYCAHFASAATLIFRYLGFEARYVEGYCIPFSRVQEGQPVQNGVLSDYLNGQPLTGYEKVVDVEIDDSCAHAWTEVFVPGKGWQVVDVTPASLQEEETGTSFGFLADLFGGGKRESQEIDAQNGMQTGLDWERYRLVGIIFAILAGGTGIMFLLLFIRRKYERHLVLTNPDRRIAVTGIYQDFIRYMRKKYPEFKEEATHEQQREKIAELLSSTSVDNIKNMERMKKTKDPENIAKELIEQLPEVFCVLRRALYSKCEVSEEEYHQVADIIGKLRKRM